MDALENLLTLQRALARLKEVEAGLETMPQELASLHAEHDQRSISRVALETEQEQGAAERRLHEAEAADVRVRLERLQEQIPQLRTQREYAAMLQEIDAAKARVRELDDLTLAALERHDEASRELEALGTASAAGDAAYQEALAGWEQDKPTLRAEAERLRGTIATLREQLSRPHQSLFDRVFQRTGGEALAVLCRHEGPVSAFYHCGACHYQVRFQVVAEIRRNELRQCDGCKRILYAEADGTGG